MKKHFLEKCSQVYFNLGAMKDIQQIYGEKNENLQISTDKNILTLNFTCE